jgi:pimeloyl-ACP methyl ester carboxylesterase
VRELVHHSIRALSRLPSPARVPGARGVLRSVYAARRWVARLRLRHVTVDGLSLPVLEGGPRDGAVWGPPLVLLHGFSDRKDAFVESVRHLSSRYRVILPDLPGFGDAPAPPGFDYSIAHQARVLERLLDALGVDELHLGGSSMGGAIALECATRWDARLRSLTLISTAGVDMPTPSPLAQLVERGRNPFILERIEDYPPFLAFLFERPPPAPAAVVRELARETLARAPHYAAIMRRLLEERVDYTAALPRLHQPTLVVWGDRDRLIDPSSAAVLARALPNVKRVTLAGIGHCPHYESPDELAHVLAEFLRRVDRWPAGQSEAAPDAAPPSSDSPVRAAVRPANR